MASDARVVLATVEKALFSAVAGKKRQPPIHEVISKYHGALEDAEKPASMLRLAAAFSLEGQHVRAGKIYAKLGYKENAMLCIEKLSEKNQFADAGELYEQCCMKREAADAYYKDNSPKALAKAGALYEELGMKVQAAESFLKCANFAKAAVLFEQEGMREEAADAYKKGRMPEEAARIYIELGKNDDALNSLLAGSDASQLQAAEMLYAAGDKRRAAEILEKIWRAGPTVCIGLGFTETEAKADRIATIASARAMEIYTELGMTDKAIGIRSVIDTETERVWRESSKDYD